LYCHRAGKGERQVDSIIFNKMMNNILPTQLIKNNESEFEFHYKVKAREWRERRKFILMLGARLSICQWTSVQSRGSRKGDLIETFPILHQSPLFS